VSFETAFYHKNGSVVWFDNVASSIRDEHEKIVGFHGASRNVTERKQATAEKEKLIEELKQALAEVKTLSGMLPVCAHCKKIRDDQGYWNQMESYITNHSDALFSHCVCPDCATQLYPEYLPKKK
jgi:6-phosphogluconate dehydrogenase (decarboxylating)